MDELRPEHLRKAVYCDLFIPECDRKMCFVNLLEKFEKWKRTKVNLDVLSG